MFAIISDIHSNLEALQAVLADIDSRGIKRIVCLGDVIGYGPNPAECIERAMEWDLTVLGNHDQAALFEPEGFGKNARQSFELLRRLAELRDLGVPLVVGASRKSFIRAVDDAGPEERLGGTIAACLWCAAQGADVLRVHDVRAVRQALSVTEMLAPPRAPEAVHA